MYLPRGDEYNQAIQNPLSAFKDGELKLCKYEHTPLGLPKPYSGGFTTTYHLFNHPTKDFAVRCFTRQINELEKRYSAISNFLKANKASNYFVNAEYQQQGINVNGTFYPIIKMDWSQGLQLNFFITKNIGNHQVIEQLLTDFKNLILELEKKRVAHGDLQHGNIIVKDSKMVLIDYDGMYLDNIKELKANEIGHPNYQHPLRTEEHYNHRIDYFSSIVIYTALRAINIRPDLWQKYDNGENMLFKASDFVDIDNSPLVKELEKVEPIKSYVESFKKIRFLEFEKIPSLTDFIQGKIPKGNLVPFKTIPVNRGAYPIIDAKETEKIANQIGKRVEIVGMVHKTVNKKDKNEEEYKLLLLGSFVNKKFGLSVIYWPKVFKTIKKLRLTDPNEYYRKWVSITGVVEQHKGLLTIEIENPAQVQVITQEEGFKKINSAKTGNTIGDLFPQLKTQHTNNSQQPKIELPWYLQNKDWFK